MGAFDDIDARYAAVNKPTAAPQNTGSAFDDIEQRHAEANAPQSGAKGDDSKSWLGETWKSVKSAAEPVVAAEETSLHDASGALSSLAGGIAGEAHGWYDFGKRLLNGESLDQANAGSLDALRNTFNDVSGAGTYEPRTDMGKQLAGSYANLVNIPPAIAAKAGDVANQVAGPEAGLAAQTILSAGLPIKGMRATTGAMEGAAAERAAAPKPEVPQVQTPDLQSALDDLHAKAAQGKASVNDEAQQRHLEADSLPVPVKLTKGQATQDPSALSAEQNERGASPELANHFKQQNDDLVANFDAIKEKAAPDVTATNKVEHGQNLVDAYKEMDDKAQADINAKYQALRDANGGQFPVDGKAFANKALSDLANSDVEESLPSDVRAAVTKYQNGQPMDFNRFTGMQKVLSAAARKADRAGDGNASHAISIVRDSLESLPLTQETAAIKPLADAARAAARARFQRIESDPAYAAAVKDGAAKGEPSPLADTFVQKYVVGAPAANVAKMRQNLAGDPMAGQNLAAATIDHIRDNAIKSGNLSQAALNKQLANLGPKIPTLLDPESAAHVNNLGKVAGYTQAQPRGSFVNNSNTAVAQRAMNVASGVASKVPVAGPYVAEKIQQKAQQTRLKDMLKPGAGIAK